MPEVEKIGNSPSTDDSKDVRGETKKPSVDQDDTVRNRPIDTDHSASYPHHRHRILATSESLFVTGFAKAINQSHIERLFSKFGRTERITDMMQSKASNSESRYCFVEYDSIESAQKAIDNLNGRMLLRRRLVVRPAHANTKDKSGGTMQQGTSLHPAKEKALLEKKIAALKKRIQESQKENS